MRKRTRRRRYTRTQKCTSLHTHMFTRTYTHASYAHKQHTQVALKHRIHRRTNTNAHTHTTHTHTRTPARTQLPTHPHTHTHPFLFITHTHTHAHTHTHVHTHTRTHTHTHKHSHIHLHTYTHAHACTHTHTCTHMHTCTYTHVHARTYTHTHTHRNHWPMRRWPGSWRLITCYHKTSHQPCRQKPSHLRCAHRSPMSNEPDLSVELKANSTILADLVSKQGGQWSRQAERASRRMSGRNRLVLQVCVAHLLLAQHSSPSTSAPVRPPPARAAVQRNRETFQKLLTRQRKKPINSEPQVWRNRRLAIV